MAGPGEQGEPLISGGMVAAIATGLAAIVVYNLFREQINWMILRLYHGEIWFLTLFHMNDPLHDSHYYLNWISRVNDPGSLTGEQMARLSRYVGKHARWVVVPLLLGGALWRFSRYVRFPSRVYTIESLARAQLGLFPYCKAALEADLLKQPLYEGLWRVSEGVVEWCRKRGVLREDNTVDQERAWKELEAQLGPKWTSVEDLPWHTRCLFVVFAVFVNGERGLGTDLLKLLAERVPDGETDFPEIREAEERYANTDAVRAIVEKHAYVHTVMFSMLGEARANSGKVESAKFNWLKPVDRVLWYTLNCVARIDSAWYATRPWPECMGVYVHWCAEKRAGQKIERPALKKGVEGISLTLERYEY